MPHAVFRSGTQTASASFGARALIPGVTPGGQFAGKAKPALVIDNVRLGPFNDLQTTVDEYFSVIVSLILSQENDLEPAFLLPIGQAGGDSVVTQAGLPLVINNYFMAAGTIWAPAFVGVRAAEIGTLTYNIDVHLDYHVVFLPWRDWFVHWEFLDGVTNLSLEY